MSMQRSPINAIEKRKQDVRVYSRNATISVIGGVVGGITLGLLASSWGLFILGLVIAVAGGLHYSNKVKKIINHRDQY
ncbi:putative secreted protein [Corynebacterium kutscheri]|uniref:Secreted protein n=1 Tax=Corynebacterium kutscheri TaxID=35755 RepID=A0A0F6R2B1_9CORY|nr:hypothetical protein [Corynebacterium kutscheri]AKE41533.1 hypothetical protein UL82_06840 [Corynebacterium kutscheri]VEH08811.1 putative secreted protein [Corynebacterium kutscheri]VEH09857.1 putative secreted protein [Corynebacterium kutscheri]VEH79940.1 putative secreted protein [Corynebacterium kutscheri]